MVILEAQWARFLEVLAQCGIVAVATRAAGMDRTTPYHRRDTDPAFAAAWEEALQTSYDLLEAALRERAVDGVEEPVFWQGQIVGHVRKYSDSNGQFLARAYRPERFRDRLELSGQVDVAATILERRKRALSGSDDAS
jgi:hypothetical protein